MSFTNFDDVPPMALFYAKLVLIIFMLFLGYQIYDRNFSDTPCHSQTAYLRKYEVTIAQAFSGTPEDIEAHAIEVAQLKNVCLASGEAFVIKPVPDEVAALVNDPKVIALATAKKPSTPQ